jgi:hypothetical protein
VIVLEYLLSTTGTGSGAAFIDRDVDKRTAPPLLGDSLRPEASDAIAPSTVTVAIRDIAAG